VKKINKGNEPKTLTNYRSAILKKDSTSENIYNDFPNKTKAGCNDSDVGNLRKQLLEEQGYLCCYCMSRINCDTSKIEHFKDQSANRDLQIDYQNLFIACEGNEGHTKKQTHCDTFKGANALNHINLLSEVENKIKYQLSEGMIYSDDSNIDMEINAVLNLNVKLLKNNRKQAISQFITEVKKKLGKNRWSKNALEKEVDRYKKKDVSQKFKQFSEMFVYALNKKLKKL